MLTTVLIFLPIAAGLALLVSPARSARAAGGFAITIAVVEIGLWLGALVDFDFGRAGLQHDTTAVWFEDLGASFKVGLYDFTVWLIGLTVVVMLAAMIYALWDGRARPRPYFALLLILLGATVGVFASHDLLLFYVFFELMLIPLYVLIGVWGGVGRQLATIKLLIYTLAGSLLMLVAIVAFGLQQGTFDLTQMGASTSTWIFLGFMAAFVIKAPLWPFHGWLPDAYRQAPPEVAALLSGVISKTATFGVLRIVLPSFPEPVAQFQDTILALAVIGLIYGSLLAFRQHDFRGVVAYSSLAQMCLIFVGLFAVTDSGIGGGMFQMVNHGLVSAALFLLAGAVERAHGYGRVPPPRRDGSGAPDACHNADRRGRDCACCAGLECLRERVPRPERRVLDRLGLGRRRCTRDRDCGALHAPSDLGNSPCGRRLRSARGHTRSTAARVGRHRAVDCDSYCAQRLAGCDYRPHIHRQAHRRREEQVRAVSEFSAPPIDWAGLSPYLVALFGAATILLTSVFLRQRVRRAFAAASAGVTLLGALAASLTLYVLERAPSGLVADAIQRDDLAHLAQSILFGTAILAVLVSYRERTSDEHVGEFYGLIVAAVAGMAFLAASSNLMTLFLGLEWFSICLYLLSAIATDRITSLEAGLKYLVIGSFASAILLFGLALVYGATGTIGFAEIAQAAESDNLLLISGLSMILIGLGFKVSAAPLHQWTPDVYQGAPTSVTGFMAAATKVAVFVLALRLLNTSFPDQADLWTITLGVLAAISLAWGNLAALAQRDVKRILAYSSISHAGFLLMPLAAGNDLGARALLFYLIPYAAMTVGSFAIVAARERELGRDVDLEGFSGLGWERPYLGGAMAVFMLGFIGLPPTGLFLGKFYAFAALYERGWIWLMVVGAVFTAVSVYYYLGIVRSMYMRDLPTTPAATVAGGSPPSDRLLNLAVGIALVISVGTFFGVDPLIDVIRETTAVLTYPFT